MLALTLTDGSAIEITIPPSTKERKVRIKLPLGVYGKVRLAFDADRDIGILRDNAINREEKR